MTNNHDKRINALTTAAKAKSAAKTTAVEQAIRSLIKRGDQVTFQSVGREAGVSHTFLYSHPRLRTRIEQLRAQNRPTPTTAAKVEPESTLVEALTMQINLLKKQHRQETQALHDALERAHGENLDLRREIARRG